VERDREVWGGVGTLLGPEGAGNCFFSDWVPAGFGWWGWSYVWD